MENRADHPVYLWVHDEEPEIKSATRLWGKITGETQVIIRDEIKDEKATVACIGPGGENLVKRTCVYKRSSCAAGRTGMGAVMGAKNLKAVAVRGTHRVGIADEEEFREVAEKAFRETPTGWAHAIMCLVSKFYPPLWLAPANHKL